MEKKGKIFSARLKSTGEVIVIRKEPEGTLFQDFYADYRGNNYYSEDEFEVYRDIKPLEIKLTEKQTVEYQKFCDEHSNPDFKIGGIKRLIFVNTGIGWSASVECPLCGAKKDLTDYETW